MTRSINEGLVQAPDFTPHRAGVTAADGTVTTMPSGMVANPFEDIFAQIQVSGGAGQSINVECMLWSDLDSKFVSQSPAQKVSALTASAITKFNVGGQRFFLAVTGTFGGATVNINVAGANPILHQHA